VTIPWVTGGASSAAWAATTGFNAYPLRTTASPYFVLGARLRVTGKEYKLALTQEHTRASRAVGCDLTREGHDERVQGRARFREDDGMDAPSRFSSTPSALNNKTRALRRKRVGFARLGHGRGPHSCIGSRHVACQAETISESRKGRYNGRDALDRADRYSPVDENDPDPG